MINDDEREKRQELLSRISMGSISGDNSALVELAEQIIARSMTKAEPDHQVQLVLQSIDRFIEMGDNYGELAVNLKNYYTGHTTVPSSIPDGQILIHTHKKGISIYYDGDNNGCLYKTKEGFSSTDISTSLKKPVAVMEYEVSSYSHNNAPAVKLRVDISHAYRFALAKLDQIVLTIDSEKMVFEKDGKQEEYQVPEVSVSRYEAYRLLVTGSSYVYPLLDFDPDEDYQAYFEKRFADVPAEFRPEKLVEEYVKLALMTEESTMELLDSVFS